MRPPEAGPDRLLALTAACLLLVAAVALPPEIHPWSRAACQGLGLAGALVLAVRGGGLLAGAPRWGLALLPLAVASILGAGCRSRAIDEAADLVLLLLTGLLGRRLAPGPVSHRTLVTVLMALGTGAALQAILQRYVTYPAWAAALREQGGSDAAAILGVLESGRPSGPFILPAALGGFMALCLPLSLSRAFRRDARLPARAGALAAAILQVHALMLSRSLGAIIALAAGALLALPLLRPGRRITIGVTVVLLTLLGAGYFMLSRHLEVSAAAGLDPLTLRLGNWEAALRMIQDHPLLGVGPGSFATFYPLYMRPGMNETRFAHNSYLQAAAGWGIWILFPIGMLFLGLARRIRRHAKTAGPDAAALAGGLSFVVHNLGDFTAYLPGVAIPAALALGMGLGGAGDGGPVPGRGDRRRRRLGLSILAALAGIYLMHAGLQARSRSLLERAGEVSGEGDLDGAMALARRATVGRPGDPEPPAFLAQMILTHFREDIARRTEGEKAAERALTADPDSAILHYTRALFHQAAGEKSAAYRELYAAHRLYPLKPLYRLDPGRVPAGAR